MGANLQIILSPTKSNLIKFPKNCNINPFGFLGFPDFNKFLIYILLAFCSEILWEFENSV